MPKPQKIRLDHALVARGLAETRTQARALIMAGKVYADETRLDKAGHGVDESLPLEVRGALHPWISRGGIKLAHGLEVFGINPDGLVALDIGASTGGFTDVLLTNGAHKVYAVDVGHGQLAWKLRQDQRVVVLERTNARYISSAQVPEKINLIVCDASFIGLETLLPASLALASGRADLVALIKPQFEVGRGQVGKRGVVRDPVLHDQVCQRIQSWLTAQPGWQVRGVCESPITGPQGNKEFLIAGRKGAVKEG